MLEERHPAARLQNLDPTILPSTVDSVKNVSILLN
jgi:hypothetical protein